VMVFERDSQYRADERERRSSREIHTRRRAIAAAGPGCRRRR
jgi:hypothetical protein